MSLARTSVLVGAVVASLLAALAPACSAPTGVNLTGTSSTGGGATTSTTATSATSTTSTTGTGGSGGMACVPGSSEPCYSGPAGTEGVGVCKGGQHTCAADGSGFGACTGETVPAPAEDCTTPLDDNCDGTVNEASAGCVCDPASTASCYSGPAGTEGVGLCHAGTKTCAADGKSYGPCTGEVLPVPEDCTTPADDNCNGMANEAPGCSCTPGLVQPCYDGPAGTQGVGPCVGGTQVCNAQGTGFGACTGEVLPQPETCNTPIDDNCNGQTNEGGAGCVCAPSQMVACYDGPAGTQGVGICKPGLALCNDQGTAMGACMGEVLPQAETCNTPVDDNCNGQINEGGTGCVCVPGSAAPCYTGPNGTQGVGVCKPGAKVCNALGTGFGACAGDVVPAASEDCTNTLDDNCDGQVNEGCPTVSYATSVKPIYAALCSPCHTTFGDGGFNFGTAYADSQQASFVCAGKTVGGCTIVRIQNGSMPQGAGCTGNPATDAGNPACLTAAQQATIEAWIAGGQKP